jgi:hypothetical protein
MVVVTTSPSVSGDEAVFEMDFLMLESDRRDSAPLYIT